ncbi:hypothetical protein [Pseudomonas quasicaspiana]|uniref:hypothetical protein n=1 Tax=Pseudomonas quasicaspiana TaxID=2829821 RepID=UPI001E333022|nr:hypothetical protein [Pseudomonas quasicaspiana]MCD5970406.1 hypothetical protein [Pseudomonas quasicaspiana]
MQIQPLVSSRPEATTSGSLVPPRFKPSRRTVATAIIGAALIGYLVHKTPNARQHLESLASLAQTQGDLTAGDALILAQILALPPVSN